MARLQRVIIQQFLKMEKGERWTSEQERRGESEREEGGGRASGGQIREEPLLLPNSQDQCFINSPLVYHPQQKEDKQEEGGERQKEWSPSQEQLLMELHNRKGNRWVQIARQLRRSDNSVKNHYHSRLRRALRKINKCICDHLPEGKTLKINILSRIIQAAEGCYVGRASLEATSAYNLKNQILSFVDLSQQQCSQQQIDRVRNLFSSLATFTHQHRKTEKAQDPTRTPSSKYKGKEIISLLHENKLSQQRERRKSKESQEEESIMVERREQALVGVGSVGFGSFYFINQPIYPLYFPYLEPAPISIFSGKPSSFTFYAGEEKAGEPTWTTIPLNESQ